MKKLSIIIAIALALTLTLTLSSCSLSARLEKKENYGPTVEFYTDYFYNALGGLFSYDYVCVYDNSTNKIAKPSRTNHLGAYHTFGCDSPNQEAVKQYATEKELGELNDYFYLNGTEYYLYWSLAAGSVNTLVTVKNGEISDFHLFNGSTAEYYNHTDDKVYFNINRTWSEEDGEFFVPVITFDIETGAVSQKNYYIYNSDIESRFNVSESLELPVSDRSLISQNYTMESVLKNEFEISAVSFESYVIDGGGMELSYWLQKRNAQTGELEDMRVINSEYASEIYATDTGFAVVSYTAVKSDDNYICGVDKLYITEFDEDLNEIKRTELNSRAFKNTAFFYASKYKNEIFFIGSKPRGQKTCVSVYNIETGVMKNSKNSIRGTVDGFSLIEKIDGRICHLKMN